MGCHDLVTSHLLSQNLNAVTFLMGIPPMPQAAPHHSTDTASVQPGRKNSPKLPRLCFFFLKSTLKRKICLHLLLTSYIFVHIVRGQLFLVMWDDQAALWRVPCLLPPRGVTELVAIRKEKRSLVKKKQNQQQNNLTPVTIFVCV